MTETLVGTRLQTKLLSLIIFAPLAGALINWLVGRRVRNERFIGIVASSAVGISSIVAFYLAFKHALYDQAC